MPSSRTPVKAFPCPICGEDMGVAETRSGGNYIRRRRRCLTTKCVGKRTTIEVDHPGTRIFKLDDHLILMSREDLFRLHNLIGDALALDGCQPSTEPID